MSFGQAVPRRSRVVAVDDAAACPCGSGVSFGGCCAPVLRGEPAPTAERVMRSRYTAFSTGDADHIRATWHPGTRPDAIDPDSGIRWTGLQVVGVEGGGVTDTRGVVEFVASWEEGPRTGPVRGELHERSRFVTQSGRWWYVDGEVR